MAGDDWRVGAKPEDEVGAGLTEIGESFSEALATVGLFWVGLFDEGEQALFLNIEPLERVSGCGRTEE